MGNVTEVQADAAHSKHRPVEARRRPVGRRQSPLPVHVNVARPNKRRMQPILATMPLADEKRAEEGGGKEDGIGNVDGSVMAHGGEQHSTNAPSSVKETRVVSGKTEVLRQWIDKVTPSGELKDPQLFAVDMA